MSSWELKKRSTIIVKTHKPKVTKAAVHEVRLNVRTDTTPASTMMKRIAKKVVLIWSCSIVWSSRTRKNTTRATRRASMISFWVAPDVFTAPKAVNSMNNFIKLEATCLNNLSFSSSLCVLSWSMTCSFLKWKKSKN